MSDEQPAGRADAPESPTPKDDRPLAATEGAGTVPPLIVPQEVQRSIQQVFQAALRVGPPEDPFIAKMTPQHVGEVIANKEKSNKRDFDLKLGLLIAIPVSVLALCALFLYFNEAAHLKEIIALLIGFAGGFGIGKAGSKE